MVLGSCTMLTGRLFASRKVWGALDCGVLGSLMKLS
ncbi:hypothetical protein LINPERHAP1_LOCUS40679 [Linum perenne]